MRAEINIYNEDCLQAMRGMSDGQYDLAIVDVPYTDDYTNMKQITVSNKGQVGDYHYNTLTNAKPKSEYWSELRRVSKNQIVWGANYLVENLTATPCVIVWDKDNTGNFADCEIAFATYQKAARIFKWRWNGMLQQKTGKNKQKRIHPTEKPYELYRWLLQNYASEGDLILDTHLGSGSIAVACWDEGYNLDAYEIDKDYYEAACKRLETHKQQLQIW